MELRLLCLNIHKGIGWKTRQSTLHRIQSELTELQPDLIFLQEVLGSQFQTLSSGIWPYCDYGKNSAFKKDYQGNAILSKLPITHVDNINLSMHRYEHRGLLHVILQTSNSDKPIHLLCAHLGLLSNDRRKQIAKIIDYVKQTIPEHSPIIFAGDFNDWNSYISTPLKNELELDEAFLMIHKAYAKTYPAWSPILKLDRIYSRGLTPVSAQRLMTKSWRNLSDHIGIEVTLEST